MKKLSFLILTVLLLCVLAYGAYIALMPRVKIENLSSQFVQSVTVELPNNTLTFGPLKSGDIQVIYYSLNQSDGAYKYHVKFDSDEEVSGECGYVSSNDLGKSFLITLRPDKDVSCNG